jgi:hypothetical protein
MVRDLGNRFRLASHVHVSTVGGDRVHETILKQSRRVFEELCVSPSACRPLGELVDSDG